ncbi:MAG: amidohydrolase [Anaerolineae bacterium]|nr:amidohydrolase [Anaerolineae bacterium]
MTEFDLLIQDCLVLLPDFSILPDAAIGIKDSRIALLESVTADSGSYTAREIIDGSGKLAMPGFIDAHTHAAQQLLRGSVVDELPMVWTRILVPFESNLAPEDVYRGALLFCVENLKAGTTTFADAGGPFMEMVARAALETGMRGLITRSTMDCGQDIPDKMKESTQVAIRNCEHLYKDWNGAGDGRIRIGFGLRQAMTSTPALMEAVAARSRELNTSVHIHLAEHMAEVAHCLTQYKMRPAEWFEHFGLLGPNLIAAHCVRLSDKEILLLAERGANPVHCPHSNLGNHGFSKTPLMLALGMNIALGTDGVSATRLNLFEPMRLLKFAMQARHGVDINDPLALPAQEVYHMATQGGAKAVMQEKEIGRLEVGMKADILLLDIERPHLTPTAHLPKTIVTAAGPDDVSDVIVDGKLLIHNHEFLNLDEDRIRYDAGQAMLDVGRRANFSFESFI